MANFSPVLSMVIWEASPKTVKSLMLAPAAWKLKVVVPFENPGSAGHVVFVGSQEVEVCAAMKAGSSARRAEINNILYCVTKAVRKGNSELTIDCEPGNDSRLNSAEVGYYRDQERRGGWGGRCDARRTDWMFCTDKDPKERWERFVQATVQVK